MINECNLCWCKKISCLTAESLYWEKFKHLDKYFYRCNKCGASVWCHWNTKNPLWTLATKPNRDLRNKCHRLLDPLWQNKSDWDYKSWTRWEERKRLYKYISDKMWIPIEKMHFWMFDIPQCRQALEIINDLIITK